MKYLLLLLLLSPFMALADTATITFTPPTERVDNTPLPASEIGGYNVFVNGVEASINPLPPESTSFSLDLTSGEYSVAITAFDTDTRESSMSAPLVVNVPSGPKPPSNLSVTITVNVVIQ